MSKTSSPGASERVHLSGLLHNEFNMKAARLFDWVLQSGVVSSRPEQCLGMNHGLDVHFKRNSSLSDVVVQCWTCTLRAPKSAWSTDHQIRSL